MQGASIPGGEREKVLVPWGPMALEEHEASCAKVSIPMVLVALQSPTCPISLGGDMESPVPWPVALWSH